MILLLILGFGLLLFGFSVDKNVSALTKFASTFKISGVAIIILGLSVGMFKQINAGNVGVKSLYGNVDATVLESGLNLVNPLVDVTEMNIQTQNYTMSAVHDEGAKEGDDAIRVLSADGLEVIIDLTVLYRILPTDAPKIYKTIGVDFSEKIVRPVTRTDRKSVV